MSKAKHASRPDTAVSANGYGGWARGSLLAGLTALYVARPLLPSEAAAESGEGMPFVMLSLVALLAWLLVGVFASRSPHLGWWRFRAGWTDAAFAALLVLHSASALAAARHNAPRPAMNMLWEWVGLGIGFFLIRQVLETKREARALVAVMLGLAVVLSAFGLRQYFVTMPATRAKYEADKESTLREAGILAPPDSPERMLLERRLESTEPTATYALANSLAGYLVSWLVVGLGVATVAVTRSSDSPGHPLCWSASPRVVRAGIAGCALPIAGCLLLTKSRSAYVAFGFGLLALGLVRCVSGRELKLKAVSLWGGLVAAAVLLFAGAGVWLGAIDREVVTEATKSLAYRGQYWQSSLAMIRDYPWLGCGPGNFQDYYTRYKLPGASEVVSDPHNFAFEIWATAGTPALVALACVVAGAAWSLGRTPTARTSNHRSDEPFGQPDLSGFVLAGGVLGFVLAHFAGQVSVVPLPAGDMLGGLAVGALCMGLLYPWIRWGRLPTAIPLLGATVLAVNLSAAGGIGLPGVAGSLWLLLSLGLWTASPGDRARSLPTWGLWVAVATCLALTLVFLESSYRPVMACRTALMRVESEAVQTQAGPGYEAKSDKVWASHSTPSVESLLEAAAIADPYAEEPWKLLAARNFDRWRADEPERFGQWERCNGEVLRLRPLSSASWQQSGERYLEHFLRHGRRSSVSKAVNALERAVELYPNLAAGRAKLALALAAAGEGARAAAEAAEALRLDALTPHDDQKLNDELRRLLLRSTGQLKEGSISK